MTQWRWKKKPSFECNGLSLSVSPWLIYIILYLGAFKQNRFDLNSNELL